VAGGHGHEPSREGWGVGRGYPSSHGGKGLGRGLCPSTEFFVSILDLKMASFGALWDASGRGGGMHPPSPRGSATATYSFTSASLSVSAATVGLRTNDLPVDIGLT